VPLTWWCDYAWLPGGRVERGVVLTVSGERFTAVGTVPVPPPGAERLPGLTLPGLANAHSHAFHRALRGRTHAGRGTFWTWREQMYDLAARLTPDSYLELARATYAEMALAGITTVGEFHYLHHDPSGRPYADPNAMGAALAEAARAAGVRLTLLDTCYLHGGFGRDLEGPQRRFGDGTAAAWRQRVDALRDDLRGDPTTRVGAAIHSCRALNPAQLADVAGWAADAGAPLHAHVSEQRAENAECVAAYGRTPTELLAEAGALGPAFTAVHATHLTDGDVKLLGAGGVCLCPSTERDLADGIGPARRLADAGAGLSVGSDSNAVIDLLAEARSVELDQRLATETRGHFTADELLTAATSAGQRALGWPDAGALAAGRLADFITVRLDTVRTAGAGTDLAGAVVHAGTAADVHTVVVAGRTIVAEGTHQLLPDVAGALDASIGALW
jgi:formiminoglutamate deiminase